MSALAVRDVHKRFGPVEVLKGINLEMSSGEFTVLVGPFRLRQVDIAQHHRRPGASELRQHPDRRARRR